MKILKMPSAGSSSGGDSGGGAGDWVTGTVELYGSAVNLTHNKGKIPKYFNLTMETTLKTLDEITTSRNYLLSLFYNNGVYYGISTRPSLSKLKSIKGTKMLTTNIASNSNGHPILGTDTDKNYIVLGDVNNEFSGTYYYELYFE